MTEQTRQMGASPDDASDYRTRHIPSLHGSPEAFDAASGDEATHLTADPDDELTAVATRLQSLYSQASSSGGGERSSSAPASRTRGEAPARAVRRSERRASASASSPQRGEAAPQGRSAASAFRLRRGEPSRGRGSRVAARPRGAGAGVSQGSRRIGRVAAPVVFLIAVIAVFALAVESGVFGGGRAAAPPAPVAQRSVATKTYVVKSGDTFSGIAARLHVDVETIRSLNPKVRESALVVGQKILVPRK